MENNTDKTNKPVSEKTKTIIGACLLVVFITLFIVGFNSGEAATVFSKAVNICLECIGIG